MIDEAARGRSGVRQLESNYRSVPALAAYSPLDLPGLDWVMKVEVPIAEALAPVRDFQRQVLVSAVGLAVLLTLFSMWAAGWFTRPIRTLIERAREVIGGDLTTVLRLDRNDEFGELSDAMQGMTNELRVRRDTADAARERTDALLGRFLPAGIVREVRDRDLDTDDFNIAEEMEALSLVIAELDGYQELMQTAPPLEAIAALDDLVQLVDDASERAGVEKVRTVGPSYFAAAGLSAPQLDHMQRAIAFARDVHAIIERFRKETGLPLSVRIVVASGPVVAGVIGRDRLSFDMFGPAMVDLEELKAQATTGEILVSDTIRNTLGDAIATRPGATGAGHVLADVAPPEPVAQEPDAIAARNAAQ